MMEISAIHYVNQSQMKPPFDAHLEQIVFAMGCFWGAEKRFWQLDGVYTTAVGYIAGTVVDPTYHHVCTGLTGHAEAVLIVFDPESISLDELLRVFWESHDPTQGDRQGNDRGPQYRSGIYTYSDEQLKRACKSRDDYQVALTAAGYPTITSEIKPAKTFYYAEEYHQQYLAKNVNGYCGLGGTKVVFPQ